MRTFAVVIIVLAAGTSAEARGQAAARPQPPTLATAAPQPQALHFPVTATVVKTATVFWKRDATHTSLVVLQPGTTVQILARDGPWYLVSFPSSLGNQPGLMAPYDVHIDPSATLAVDAHRAGAVSERGFAEARGFGFAKKAPNDPTVAFGDALVREELFLKPSRTVQFAIGADVRGSSHDQVAHNWTIDTDNRGILRPRLALHRLAVTLALNHVTVNLGKQFIRWGRADILSPVDRFAPRDYMNVLDSEFLPVTGAHVSAQAGSETVEAVWLPRMTPSRLPLLDQRWTVPPPAEAGFTLETAHAVFPTTADVGARWSHSGRFEMGVSLFDGVNHLPDIDAAVDPSRGVVTLSPSYARLRTIGGEAAVPTRAFTLKGETAYFISPAATDDEYVLYVVEGERQVGEWLFDIGYAGEMTMKTRGRSPFAAERGVARSIIGRASLTVDPRRTLAIEGAARQDGRGYYVKGEFSEAIGRHWRLTLAAAGITGKDDDFLGQYRHNSNGSATLRLSF